MADCAYLMAWFRLHKDSWGTAVARLKGTSLGTKQILMVNPYIRMPSGGDLHPLPKEELLSKMLSLLRSLGIPAVHPPLRQNGFPFSKFCSATLSQHIPTYCKIPMTRKDVLI